MRLLVFPDAESMCVPEQAWLARHLHPLVSIELPAIEPHGTGRVHLLSPLEPCEGDVGGHRGASHDACTRANRLAFRPEVDDRYRFLGDQK